MNLFGLEDREWIFLATVVFTVTTILGSYSTLKLHRKTGRPYTLGLISFGWILQTIGLYARGLQYGGCPLANRFELVQFLVWSAIVLYIFVGPAFRVSLLGMFTSGFASLLSILSLGFESWDSPGREPIFGLSPWIEMHAALALFSYGVFGILALTSSMYLLQSRSLKQKKMGGLFPYMPSILELTHINLRLLVLGFCILSISLAIGSVYWSQDIESVNTLKLGATIAVWLAYGILLLLRKRESLSYKQYSWACIIIFAIALLSLDAVDSSSTPVAGEASISIPSAHL
jgi:HemX protein